MRQGLDDRGSLRILDGIRVEVDAIPSLARAQGLSAERLQEDIEAQLLGAKVEVLPMGTFRTGDPHLQVVVLLSDVQDRLVGSRVKVNFTQICFLRRDPSMTFNRAHTWSASAPVVVGPVAQVAERIRRETTRQVEQFIADYRQVNQ